MLDGRATKSWYLGRRLICVAMIIGGALNIDRLDWASPFALPIALIWFGAAVFWFLFPWMMRTGLGGYHGGAGWGGGGGDRNP